MPVCVSQVLCHLVEHHLPIYTSLGHQPLSFYEVKVVESLKYQHVTNKDMPLGVGVVAVLLD